MIDFFARHSTAANLLMALMVIIGLSALPGLQRETFPDFTAEKLEIRLVYPGASAEDVEEAVCQRIEDALDSISEVEEVTCVAREGLGRVVVEMTDGSDMPRFMEEVKSEVEAIGDFPEQVELPIISELGRTDKVVAVAVTGPMTVSDLKAYAEQIKQRMQQLPEISQIDVLGFSDHQLRIEVSAQALRGYGVSMLDVADVVRRQGIDLPAGILRTHDQDLLLRFADLRRSSEELADLVVVSARSGAEIRLGDIAQISDRFELDEQKTLFNGRRAAVLQVIKTRQQDSLVVMASVSRFLAAERQRAPPGVEFTVTQDRSSIVSDRLNLLLKNGGQGLILVFLTMWLFFQLRFAFWVAVGLPISFLGALYIMGMLGLTINMITMVALLIAIGLLMDDAIVISENIAAHLRKGKAPVQAAIDGAKQVAPGVISSFLTTIAVFGPLAFLSGHMGSVLKFIPMVLCLVLAVSLIEAFLILPYHLAHSLQNQSKKTSRFRRCFEQQLDYFRQHILGQAVDFAVRQRYWFVGSVIALFLLSMGMVLSGKLKYQVFPSIEGDIIEARVLLPQGTPLWRTELVVQQITDGLKVVNEQFSPRQPDGQPLVQNIQVRYSTNQDAGESGPHLATITADLITAEERKGRLDDIINHWRNSVGEIPDLIALNYKEPVIGPAGIPLEMRLSGSSLKQLKQASLELQGWLGRYQGVFDLSDDLRPGKPELRIRLREGTLALGLDATTIANQLRAAFFGVTASEILVEGEAYEIDVRLAQSDQSTLTDLETFRIVTANGGQIPLSTLVHIESDRGFSRIRRVDGIRTVTITGDLDSRVANARELVNHTRQLFLPGLQQRYPDLQIEIGGQSRESDKTGSSMMRSFAIGLVCIFILLSFQFRSYLEPLVVMFIIPLSLIGVVWGHLLMGVALSMPGIIGFTSLAGIVVNDSILLVEFLKRQLRKGCSTVEAAKIASQSRFRAVLLTSVTTIAGLFPLLLEKSMQAQILIPLAVSIIFGLLATTLLVLLVVPALFSILDDFKAPSSNKTGRPVSEIK